MVRTPVPGHGARDVFFRSREVVYEYRRTDRGFERSDAHHTARIDLPAGDVQVQLLDRPDGGGFRDIVPFIGFPAVSGKVEGVRPWPHPLFFFI